MIQDNSLTGTRLCRGRSNSRTKGSVLANLKENMGVSVRRQKEAHRSPGKSLQWGGGGVRTRKADPVPGPFPREEEI